MGALGDLIREFRDAQKGVVSDAEIARQVGVTRSAVGTWMRGESLPRPEHLRSLAAYTALPYGRVLDAALTDAGYYTRPGRELTAAQEQDPGPASAAAPAGGPAAPAGSGAPRGPRVGPARHGRTRTRGTQPHGST